MTTLTRKPAKQNADPTLEGINILLPVPTPCAAILSAEALRFVARICRKFEASRAALLQARRSRQAEFDAGRMPDFLPDTADIRRGDWTVSPLPKDLLDRRVEITGPVDRKMIINALNSGAKVYMADFEDSHAPTWDATLQGQANLRDAVRRTIEYTSPEGKLYSLDTQLATLMVRPRGWHLVEKHLLIDGQPVSASLFDFGLFFFHNARFLVDKGSGPYFYLPKMESRLEARLWNEVFLFAQDALELPKGTIKATALIETLPAVFEMNEILFELREHSAGLNCGRWDYIFSFIKKLNRHPRYVMPDRAQVTMTTHFLRSYSKLLIDTCHRRGVHAMGGMAAQIPIKNDPEANEEALGKVRTDKEREVRDGHDGTWVAHPGLVPLAKKVFDSTMKQPNQLTKRLEGLQVTSEDLLTVPQGTITEQGLKTNLDVGVQYLAAWLAGSGCVPIYNLMEDAATAEISRSQVWQWVHHQARLSDGRPVTLSLTRSLLKETLGKIKSRIVPERYSTGKYDEAAQIFDGLIAAEQFEDFLTLAAYGRLD